MQSDIVERLRGWCPHEDECPRVLIDEAAEEIERLRAELAAMRQQRDEARREFCELHSLERFVYDSPEEIAVKRGWDCYEEKEGGGA